MNVFDLPPLSKKGREMRRVFTSIYRVNGFGGGESRSGPGSSRGRTASFLPDLVELTQALGVRTLLDVPCGDFNWAGPLAEAVEHYIGVDVVPSLIRANRQQWASTRRTFVCRDMLTQKLPAADLVLCRDALVHFATKDALLALANLSRTRAEYLIATTFVDDRTNSDIPTGEWRPLNMQRPPFLFPAPLELIDEHCRHTDGIYADKRLGLWRLKDLGPF